MVKLAVIVALPASSPDGWDEMSAVTGRVFVAQTPETFEYDADGNMTCDGRFRYTWNGENRLVRAQELVAPTNRNPYTIAYAYDHRGRMVSKRITENDGHDTLVKSIAYLWDGWNIIRETQWPVTSDQWSVGPLDTNHYPLVTDYVWGLDLDGTMQGAGGVGGLLAVLRSDCAATNSAFCILHSALYLPTYDANGNVSEYIDESGELVAHYDYSPFGETLIESGDLASTFTHRFSTKPWCPVTGLYEYQMRKYRPEIGRWLSRDPIGEKGGENLSLMSINAPINYFDILGFILKVCPQTTDTSLSNQGNLITKDMPSTDFTKFKEDVVNSLNSVISKINNKKYGICAATKNNDSGCFTLQMKQPSVDHGACPSSGSPCLEGFKLLAELINSPKETKIIKYSKTDDSFMHRVKQEHFWNVGGTVAVNPEIDVLLPVWVEDESDKKGKKHMYKKRKLSFDIALWHELAHAAKPYAVHKPMPPGGSQKDYKSNNPVKNRNMDIDIIIKFENEIRKCLGEPLRFPFYNAAEEIVP